MPSQKLARRTRLFLLGIWALSPLVLSCHRLAPPVDLDPRLPQAFRTPEATFRTWVEASRAGDAPAIRACYWSGLSPEELGSWMRENLRPEAQALLGGAKLLEVRPKTRVEVNFTFSVQEGAEQLGGVMVRTREGWKLQSW